MPRYTFASNRPSTRHVTIEASDEQTARRLAMQNIWGPFPDCVTPHTPHYDGTGLVLVSMETAR